MQHFSYTRLCSRCFYCLFLFLGVFLSYSCFFSWLMMTTTVLILPQLFLVLVVINHFIFIIYFVVIIIFSILFYSFYFYVAGFLLFYPSICRALTQSYFFVSSSYRFARSFVIVFDSALFVLMFVLLFSLFFLL